MQAEVLDAAGKPVLDGKDWEWANFDAARKRIVYAARGAIFAISPRGMSARHSQMNSSQNA